MFLTEWEGLLSGTGDAGPVIVVGATNLLDTIDDAILRRMPVKIQTKLPNRDGRVAILRKLLQAEAMTDPETLIEEVANLTEKSSGSDLKNLVQAASIPRIHEFFEAVRRHETTAQSAERDAKAQEAESGPMLRHLTLDDFISALRHK